MARCKSAYKGWLRWDYPGLAVYVRDGRGDLPRIQMSFKQEFWVGGVDLGCGPFKSFEHAETYWMFQCGHTPELDAFASYMASFISGSIEIYSGVCPATADAEPTGMLLGTIIPAPKQKK